MGRHRPTPQKPASECTVKYKSKRHSRRPHINPPPAPPSPDSASRPPAPSHSAIASLTTRTWVSFFGGRIERCYSITVAAARTPANPWGALFVALIAT